MTADEIVKELRSLGSESIRKVLLKHGAREPLFGVKIEDLKKLKKRVGTDYQLALDLYATGIYDAMYLAGIIADDTRMTKKDLQKWVDTARSRTLCGYVVAPVAAGGRHGRELALKWIDSPKESVAATGWATLGSLVSITPDEQLDLVELQKLLDRAATSIHDAPNHVRYAMNAFVISVGCYVAPLTAAAVKTAKAIGTVTVDMGDTGCKVPLATDYLRRVRDRGTLGKKRKSARC